MDSLYEFVPKDLLPEEYGGKAGTFKELTGKNNNILNDIDIIIFEMNIIWKIQGKNIFISQIMGMETKSKSKSFFKKNFQCFS